MELTVLPRDAFLGQNKVFSGSMIDDKDLARVGIWLFPEVEVVEVGRILVVEEEAEIAVTPGGLGCLDPGGENKGSNDLVLKESYAVRAAEGGAISGDAEEFVDLVAIHGGEFPFGVVGGLPCAGILGEVLLVNDREFLVGMGWEGEGKGSEDER